MPFLDSFGFHILLLHVNGTVSLDVIMCPVCYTSGKLAHLGDSLLVEGIICYSKPRDL